MRRRLAQFSPGAVLRSALFCILVIAFAVVSGRGCERGADTADFAGESAAAKATAAPR